MKTKTTAPSIEEAPITIDFALAPVTAFVEVEIKHLILDAGTQPRLSLDTEVIEDYAEQLKKGEKSPFPPIDVFRTLDGKLYLADGFHRTYGHKKAGFKEIEANIHDGTLLQAQVYALQANAQHGLRRSNKDKLYAYQHLEKITPEEQFRAMTNSEIARIIACTEGFVRGHRAAAKSSPVKAVQRKGKTVHVDTSRIGSKAGKKTTSNDTKRSVEAKAKESKTAEPEERISLQIAKVEKLIGGREGAKIAEALGTGKLPLTTREIKDWAGFTPELAKQIAPLVTTHGFKPFRAMEFVKSEPSDPIIRELMLRAIANGGEYDYKSDVVTIHCKASKK